MIVKICGIKTLDTLICCANNKVNFFGMIFYNKSPRYINIKDAILLQNEAKKLSINGVGVFVDEKISTINEYIGELGLEFIQLHGNESNNYTYQYCNPKS